jgi:hypothetical protein
MATLSNRITELKAKYPTLKVGDDVSGYVDLTSEEYEAKIEEWAAYELDAEAKAIEAQAAIEKAEADKSAAQDKLAALGLTADDLIALGFIAKQPEPVIADEDKTI